ncbi:hypothetical protein KBD81_02515 [Candidatus Woesebacteria bacterium]|nr:hypothetical protein [Candidatus Woesebacteria bacterium]
MKRISECSRIIVTGSIAYDDIMNFPGYFKDHFHPEKLHQINISFVVDKLDKHLGGTATNISFNCTRVTDKKVFILGAMGRDHRQLTDFFTEYGVDYSGCVIAKDLYTSTGKVMTDKSDNQIWGYYYGAGARGNKVNFDSYSDQAFAIISANHKDAFLHAQHYCIEHSIPYLYDPGMSLTWIDDADVLQGIQHAAYVVGNDYEIAQMERRLGKPLLDIVSEDAGVITTLGAEGVKYQDHETQLLVPSYPIKSICDPTGAGDAWRGGFIGSLIDGANIEEALKMGNALASFAVESSGTANHRPTMDQIRERSEKI